MSYVNGVRTVSNALATMDNLSYTYSTGNKLSKVGDSSGGASGFNNTTTDNAEMTYDANGNLTADLNKGITNITYNILGKPQTITFQDGRTIAYTYDASGAKLSMSVTKSTTTNTTDYAGGFVYENGNLSFFSSPEGRVANNYGTLEYQYAIADHQGNTRVVFKSAPDTPLATFEGNASDMSSQYLNVQNIVTSLSANKTDGGSKVVRMNRAYSVGPARSIRVYPGDAVDMEVYAYYENSGYGTSNLSLANLVTNVAAAFGGAPGTGESGAIYNGVNSAFGTAGMGPNQGNDLLQLISIISSLI